MTDAISLRSMPDGRATGGVTDGRPEPLVGPDGRSACGPTDGYGRTGMIRWFDYCIGGTDYCLLITDY